MDITGILFFSVILVSATLGVGLLYLTLRKPFFNRSQEYLQVIQGLSVFVSARFFTEASLRVIPLEFGIMDGFMHAASAFSALMAATLYVKNSSLKNTSLWIATYHWCNRYLNFCYKYVLLGMGRYRTSS